MAETGIREHGLQASGVDCGGRLRLPNESEREPIVGVDAGSSSGAGVSSTRTDTPGRRARRERGTAPAGHSGVATDSGRY
jgi:hypothetical protein